MYYSPGSPCASCGSGLLPPAKAAAYAYNKDMKNTTPVGPFGALRPLDLKKTSEAKLVRYHCYGWMDKVGGQWVLNERGLQLFYYV